MKHTLRKYLSSRGSALFMVLSTMTALLIVVMAMYFSVVSSRSVQYAVFNQEQSYQSSVSISDAVIAGLNDGKFSGLSSKLTSLNVGQSMTTNGNGFASLGGGIDEDANQLGAYDVTITRLDDETSGSTIYLVYDFAVTSSVNGVLETTHTIVRVDADGDKPTVSDRVFTATGYLPNENWLGLGWYYSDVHIDAEYATLGLGYSAPTFYNVNVVCAGSATFNSVDIKTSSGDVGHDTVPTTWAFGGNLTVASDIAGNQKLDMNGSSTEHGILIVGGDLIVSGSGYKTLSIPQYTDIYVLGNVILDGTITNIQGNLFVGGYLNANSVGATSGGTIYLSNNDGRYDKDQYNNTNTHIDTWITSGSYSDGLIFSEEEIIAKLNEEIGSNNYPKWEINYNDIGVSLANDAPVDILFNFGGTDIDYNSQTIPANTNVFQDSRLVYSSTNKGCIIGEIHDVAGGGRNAGTGSFVIIDTGNDPENVFTVRLEANRDEDYDGVYETFSWVPQEGSMNDTSGPVNVLIKGCGTVIFDVADGVTYQAGTFEFVGHMNWYALLSGKYSGSSRAELEQFIHTDYNTYPCVYTDTDDNGNRVYITDSDNNKVAGYWCTTHKCVVEDDDPSLCVDRVGRQEIDAYLATHTLTSDFIDYVDVDNDGTFNASIDTFIYPTTNLWLVSCDENADIRLSNTKDGSSVIGDNYFGFVYAPYMTYSAMTFVNSAGFRMAGGLIVSDFVLSDYYAYLYIKPEINYTELIGDDAINLSSSGDVSWRKYGY